MIVEINGEKQTIGDGASVSTVLNEIDARADRVAVMVNGEIIHRSCFETKSISDGDKLEVMILTAGG